MNDTKVLDTGRMLAKYVIVSFQALIIGYPSSECRKL